jgi:hypothetical protein
MGAKRQVEVVVTQPRVVVEVEKVVAAEEAEGHPVSRHIALPSHRFPHR